MKSPTLTLIALCLAPLWLQAQVTTEPIGFNKITCLANSDTIVSVPLRQQGSLHMTLTANPVVVGASATLTLAPGSLTAGALTGHFLKFIDGDRAGRWYNIQTATTGTANTDSAVTIDLNGDTLGAATTGNQVRIAQYWTLDTLFPPAAAAGVTGPTTSWTETPVGSGIWLPNGHAIVASVSRFASGRRTEIRLPDLEAVGVNIAPSTTFYIYNSGWRKQGVSYTEDHGATQLNPDSYFIVRHPSMVSHSTIYRCSGDVEMASFTIPLTVRASVKQDNAIGLPRPVDIALNDLGLLPGAFVASTSRFASGRKDELLVFNNASSSINKAPDRIYYYLNSGWRKQGESYLTDFGTDTIPAGGGFLIRKAPDNIGSTVFWNIPEIFATTP